MYIHIINMYTYIRHVENDSRQVVKKIMPLSINLFSGSYMSFDLLVLLLELDLIPPYHSGYAIEYRTSSFREEGTIT